MKRLFVISLLTVCNLYLNARNRGPVAQEWNTTAVCLEDNLGSLVTNGGWYASPWFSVYFQTPEWWIYHCTKGWLYPESDQKQGVWLYWTQRNSWIWTRQDVYPLAYDASINEWFDFCIDPNK